MTSKIDPSAIILSLDQACLGLDLIFQIIDEADTLYVYINRPNETPLEYEVLTAKIVEAIAALNLPDLRCLCLYSRILGKVDADWETFIELPTVALAEPIQENHPLEELSDSIDSESPAPEFKLDRYCFTRNRSLLISEILPPHATVAQVIQSFHGLLDRDKQSLLDVLDPFFRSGSRPSLEQLSPESQQWFEQLAQLQNTDLRKASIWLSRYCFAPEATLLAVTAVLEPSVSSLPEIKAEPSLQPVSQSPSSSRHSSTLPREQEFSPVSSSPSQRQAFGKKRLGQRPKVVWQFIAVPVIWLLFTLTAITYNVHAASNPQEIATLCKTSKGSQSYCKLAAQMVGPQLFEGVAKVSNPVAPELEPQVQAQMLRDCKQEATVNAGKGSDAMGTKQPALSEQVEEVLPGIFVADVQQKGAKDGKTLRTACTFNHISGTESPEGDVQLLDSDTIPNEWPRDSYKGKSSLIKMQETLSAHSALMMMGTNTLFTAVGLLAAILLGLGIAVDSLETLYKSAFVLGIAETFIGYIPISMLLRGSVLEIMALTITSFFIKGLEIDWSRGYRIVMFGALTLICVRALLSWLLILTIMSFVA
jgi:hypothetical protein